MKKSLRWYLEEALIAQCPFCKKETAYASRISGAAVCEGDLIYCLSCGKKFQLGRRR